LPEDTPPPDNLSLKQQSVFEDIRFLRRKIRDKLIKLIPIHEASTFVSEQLGIVRAGYLQLGKMVAPQLSANKVAQPAGVKAIIDKAVTAILTELSGQSRPNKETKSK
jgi:hypothetical protein